MQVDPIAAAPAPARLRRLSGLAPALLLGAALAAYFAHAWLYRQYVNDDAYITFRYSRFLALGRGPYFNVGEQVEGYTNFLLMLALVGVTRLFGAEVVPLVAKGVGVCAGAGALVLAWLTACRVLRRASGVARPGVWAAAAVGLVAVHPSYGLNSMSGLETLLFACLVTAGVHLGVRELDEGRWRGSALAFAGAFLTRPEGMLLFAVFWFAQAAAAAPGLWGAARGGWRRLAAAPLARALLVNGCLAAGILGAHLLWRHALYDGEWLPNTYYAKEGLLADEWGYIRDGVFRMVLGVVPAALALCGYALQPRLLRVALPLAAVAGLGAFIPLLTGGDWMIGHRLLAPYLPLIAVFVVVGWALLAAALLRTRAWVLLPLVLLLVPVQAKRWGHTRTMHRHVVELRARGYETGHRRVADWLRARAAQGVDSVALMDIGIVGFECIDHDILDITGLTDRHIARAPGGFLQKDYDVRYIIDRRPAAVVLVWTGAGRAYEEPADPAALHLWTRTERNIYEHPDFRAHYVRSRVVPADAPLLERLAAQFGAEAVFEHGFPGGHYFLAVFERR